MCGRRCGATGRSDARTRISVWPTADSVPPNDAAGAMGSSVGMPAPRARIASSFPRRWSKPAWICPRPCWSLNSRHGQAWCNDSGVALAGAARARWLSRTSGTTASGNPLRIRRMRSTRDATHAQSCGMRVRPTSNASRKRTQPWYPASIHASPCTCCCVTNWMNSSIPRPTCRERTSTSAASSDRLLADLSVHDLLLELHRRICNDLIPEGRKDDPRVRYVGED